MERPKQSLRCPVLREHSSSCSYPCRLVITPGKLNVLCIRRSGVHVFAIADDHHFGKLRSSFQLDVQGRQRGGGELVSRQVVSAPDVGKNLIRSGVHVALAETVQQRFAGHIPLHQDVGVADVGGDVVGARFKAQPVAFVERQADEALSDAIRQWNPSRCSPAAHRGFRNSVACPDRFRPPVRL